MKPLYIKTYEQFIEAFGYVNENINEGGNALDTTQRIANKDIPNTLEYITAKILPVIGLEGFNIDAAVVGSAGKKDPDVTSGDIDIAVSIDKIAGHAGIDVKGVLKYINDTLAAKGYETNIQYGFHQVNVAVPIDGDPKKGYCQVDLMVTDNLDWSKFIYFSPDYRKAESRYSGAFRGMLINAVASEGLKKAVKHDEESGEMEEYEQLVNRATHGLFKVRKTLRGKRGLVKTPKLMKDYEQKITNIPSEVIKILFGEGVTEKDVESFEGIWKVIHSKQFPYQGKLETIANKFLWYMKNMEIPVPTEIVEKYPNLIKENKSDMKRHVKLYEEFSINEAHLGDKLYPDNAEEADGKAITKLLEPYKKKWVTASSMMDNRDFDAGLREYIMDFEPEAIKNKKDLVEDFKDYLSAMGYTDTASLEEAKKEYFQSITPEEFAEIKKGDKVQYMATSFTVDSNDGYVLKLKDRRGKIVKANLGQFIHGGRIAESVNESLALSIAGGIVLGVVGAIAAVKGLKAVSNIGANVLDAAAYAIRDAKDKAEDKKLFNDVIVPIAKRFENDKELEKMYQELNPFMQGYSQKAVRKNIERTKGLNKIAKYIKSKLTKDELFYFSEVSAVLRTGEAKVGRNRFSTNESVNEGMSKSAIKKQIKTIEKQIDTETGGDGEPLTDETLQALEQELERLQGMLESVTKDSDELLFERKKVLADREGNKDTGNKLLDSYLKGLAAGIIQVAYNMLTVSNGVLDANRSANYTIGFDQFSDEWRVFGKGFESASTSKDNIKNSEDLYKFITSSVNGYSFTKKSVTEGTINEAEEKQGKKLVNIMVGRFQPFHNGHYLAAKELHDKNGLPVVLASVRAKGKTGKGTSFTDATMDKMMKDVIKKSGFIIDNVEIPFVAFDTKLFPALRPKYEPVLFGAGEDRVATYDRQRISMRDKHKNKLNMRDDFEIQLTGRYGSGTAVRNAIEKGDQKEFESTMPKFLHNYWETLSSELGMNENQTIEDAEMGDPITEEPLDRIARTIDDCKNDLEQTGASIERLRTAIENGANEQRVFETLEKLKKIHGTLILEMATMIKESNAKVTDAVIKKHINAYSVMDDPYDVAEEIGKNYGWSQKEIEKAEKIIRKKYIK